MLKIPLSGKVFKEGRPCYKGGRNVCNQNGAYGRNSLMVCKHAGKCADIFEHAYRCVLLRLSSPQLNFYVFTIWITTTIGLIYKDPVKTTPPTDQGDGTTMDNDDGITR